ncbi:hypothetical protein A5888_002725 [Enterococcus sp. 9E7_DIV0242]|uniref:Uncharacterized protein n=1 Tax=Candidatus Enterococcus clewellii TaxID=1834193 RepID=A0A242K8F3_9ENTE|nr:hypothetical protein A5888_001485 [Enterococcus sp. 9E7_DIV0242]
MEKMTKDQQEKVKGGKFCVVDAWGFKLFCWY